MTMAPSSRLDQISTVPPKVLFREIQTHAALRLPRLKYAARGVAGCCMVLLSIAALPALALVNSRNFCFLFPLGTMLIGGILMHVDQNKFPSECATLGDLARKGAGLNFGRLVTFGAKPRDADLWAALLEVLTEHSLIKKTATTTETILLQTQFRAAS